MISLKNPDWPDWRWRESLAAPRGVSRQAVDVLTFWVLGFASRRGKPRTDASRRCKQRPSKLFAGGCFFKRIRGESLRGQSENGVETCNAGFARERVPRFAYFRTARNKVELRLLHR